MQRRDLCTLISWRSEFVKCVDLPEQRHGVDCELEVPRATHASLDEKRTALRLLDERLA
jgi:hypothetical protein